MNTQSNAVSESQAGYRTIAPSSYSTARLFYWSVRREIWENRSIYLAPLIAAAVFLLGFFINLIVVRARMHGLRTNPAQQHQMLAMPYEIASLLIMLTAFVVGVFYSLDALYGERRDRSILFWKSLPVSDITAVLAKVTIPLFVLPLLSFAIAVITQWIMLLLSSLVLLGSGLSIATLWGEASLFQFSGMLLYHILTVHGLWYAPIYGWLLLASAWATRAPFLWAFLPPFVVIGLEKIAFNSSHLLALLQRRLLGPEPSMAARGTTLMDAMAAITPGQFLSRPGLWIGLAIAAAFLLAAARLRRAGGPI